RAAFYPAPDRLQWFFMARFNPGLCSGMPRCDRIRNSRAWWQSNTRPDGVAWLPARGRLWWLQSARRFALRARAGHDRIQGMLAGSTSIGFSRSKSLDDEWRSTLFSTNLSEPPRWQRASPV